MKDADWCKVNSSTVIVIASFKKPAAANEDLNERNAAALFFLQNALLVGQV
jgi:hypothetical protein